MKLRAFALIAVATLLYCSPSRASITAASWWDDGDGALVCAWTNLTLSGDAQSGTLSMSGDQYWGPGHMNGWVQTTGGTDPTLTLASDIENDTNFAWTAYIVNVYMSNTFTLSNFNVLTPGDWGVVSISAVTPTNGLGSYVVSALLDTGAPIPVGNDIAFSYQLSFSGASHFNFTQEVIPIGVPEPGAFALVALSGGLLTLARRRQRT
ncbi:MAG: PEP-CTERM sorting domain-containing protein [Verrucomicrobiia bacterium]|jgi:hypothetical protein